MAADNEALILVIDQGTTGTRAIIFNEKGEPLKGSWAYVEHKQIYPKPGWVEHDPIEIWENVKYVIKRSLEGSGADPKSVKAIGITNQRETVVAWNYRTGLPVYNAIVWQDRRTAQFVDELRAHYYELIRERTGLVPDSYFSGPKIRWILDNVKGGEIREKAKAGDVVFGTIDTWIIWNLTKGSKGVLTPERGGAFVTDYSNASRTMLFDISKLEWDPELLEVHGGIPPYSLPLPRPSSDIEGYGLVGPEAAQLLGNANVMVMGDAGDQQAALFGQAGFGVGDIKCTYGTGNFLLANTGSSLIRSRHGLLTTVYYSLEKGKAVYALEGSIFVTGAAIQWLRDGLKIIEVSAEVNPLAEAAEDMGGVYFVPAFVGLGAPYWDQYARGLIIGITRGTERKHIARAVLESIAYLTRDVVEAMVKDSGFSVSVLKADGGASKSDFLMQFQADILGIEVVRPLIKEMTSLGAAFLAGLAAGVWSGLDELARLWKPERVFKPLMDPRRREMLYSGWKKAVGRALGWAKEVPWAYGYQ